MRKVVIVIFLVFCGIISAQTCKSKLLDDLCIAVDYQLDSAIVGDSMNAWQYKGHTLCVTYSAKHVLEHIGIQIFDKSIKSDRYMNGDVLKFIERYALELLTWNKLIPLSRKIYDDKVGFLKGEWQNLLSIPDTAQFSLNRQDNKGYFAIWTVNADTILEMAFPISYELLLGIKKIEIERMLLSEVKSSHPRATDMDLEAIDSIVYRTNPIQYYEIKSLNNCRYYLLDSNKVEHLLFSQQYPVYSACNLFEQESDYDAILMVDQAVYGFNTINYSFTLREWLWYCDENNMTVYCGLENETETAYVLLVLAECKDLAFNHILSVAVPKDFITNKNAIFAVKMNAFVPTHNVKNLYDTNYKKSTAKEYE